VKSNVRDDFTECLAEVSNSSNFFSDVLGIDNMDLLEKYQQWACSRLSTLRTKNKLAGLQAESARLIRDGLSKSSNLL